MSVTAKALFVIERNLGQELNLERIAGACGVSRFHLAHAFVTASGRTVMDYVRARRLSEAARVLAGGAPNILDVAVEAGYSSHEAFSRAFRTHFDSTPEELRARGSVTGLSLQEILTMSTQHRAALPPPTYQPLGQELYVGLAARKRMGELADIPAQWRRFMAEFYPRLAAKRAGAPVGINLPGESEDELVYVCAAPVSRFANTPSELLEVTLEPARYVVFAHDGHVSELPGTYGAIWNEWFPASGKTPKRAPSLEHHNATFDPRTGGGGVTLWIPID